MYMLNDKRADGGYCENVCLEMILNIEIEIDCGLYVVFFFLKN